MKKEYYVESASDAEIEKEAWAIVMSVLAAHFTQKMRTNLEADFNKCVDSVKQTGLTTTFNYNPALNNNNEWCAEWLKYLGDVAPNMKAETAIDYFNEKVKHFDIARRRIDIKGLVSGYAKKAKVKVEFGKDSNGYTTVIVKTK